MVAGLDPLQEAAYPAKLITLYMFAVMGHLHREKTAERILCGALTHVSIATSSGPCENDLSIDKVGRSKHNKTLLSYKESKDSFVVFLLTHLIN